MKMQRTLSIILVTACILGILVKWTTTGTIYHDCQGSVSTTSDVETEQLNATVNCNFLFRTEKSRLLQASFDGFDPGYYGYADNIKIYDGDNSEVNYTSLDIADGGLVKTVIFSRGPALLVSISKSLQRSYKLNVTSFDKKYVDIRTSKYHGTVSTPRYILSRKDSDKYVMIKNLMFSCRFTPVLGSSLSINFTELRFGDENIQILPSNLKISSKSRTFRYNITIEEVSVLLDTYTNRSPRGEGFSMTFDVCGGTSNEREAKVSLPTHLFYEYDEDLRCSYVYSCPNGYVPILTLTIKEGSQSNISSTVELFMDNELLIPHTRLPLLDISESYVGNSSKLAVLLKHSSNIPFTHPVVFANFTYRKIGCILEMQGSMGTFSPEKFNGKYPNNLLCTFMIKGNPNTTLWVKLMDIDLAQTDCGDYIEIRDKGDMTTICDSGTYTYTSISNELQIVFGTDGKVTARGFTAIWESITEKQKEGDPYGRIQTMGLSCISFLLVILVI